MRKLLIALTFNLVFISSKLVAQTWVTIPDVQFYYALQGIIPAALNGSHQLNITSPLVTTRDTLNLNNTSISNLSGIQYFTSLKYLNCELNPLMSIPTLPNTITYLDCGNDFNLTSLPSPLPTSLTQFFCYNNPLLKNLPPLPNSLIYFRCDGDSLTSLPVLPNTLQTFYCFNNYITCFPTFPNSITDIDIDPNPYNCLPNYITPMTFADLSTPLCTTGNSNGCPVAVAGIEQVTGINSQISVYPNPARDVINVKGLAINEETHIQIIDMFGNFVAEYITSDKATDIDVSVLSEGVYNLSIANKEGVSNKRVVIEK